MPPRDVSYMTVAVAVVVTVTVGICLPVCVHATGGTEDDPPVPVEKLVEEPAEEPVEPQPHFPQRYTADLVTVHGERVSARMRYYFDRVAQRARVNTGENEVIIWDFNKEERYDLSGFDCSIKRASEPTVFPFHFPMDGFHLEGTTEVLGIQCMHWKRQQGPGEEEQEYFEAVETHVPVRYRFTPHFHVDFANVILASPSPSIFELPLNVHCYSTLSVSRIANLKNIAWTVVYFLCVSQGVQDRTYSIPLAPLASLLSWNFVFGFVTPLKAPYQYYNMVWFGVLAAILVQFVMSGAKVRELGRQETFFFYFSVFLSLFVSFCIILFGVRELHDSEGTYSSFAVHFFLSLLFINMLVKRAGTTGQSLSIGVTKFLGGVLALTESRISHAPSHSNLILFLSLITLFLDLCYIVLLYIKLRGAKLKMAKGIIDRMYA